MPIESGLGFTSDEIDIVIGFVGCENKKLVAWYRKHAAAFPCRVACAINQHYPELESGFYLNKAIISLIQKALIEIGLHVVIEDNYRDHGIVPEELVGCVEAADDYLLVEESLHICGRLCVWESFGGMSALYHDRLVIDVISNDNNANRFVDALEKQCKSNSLAFNKTKSAINPEHDRSGVQRFFKMHFLKRILQKEQY